MTPCDSLSITIVFIVAEEMDASLFGIEQQSSLTVNNSVREVCVCVCVCV